MLRKGLFWRSLGVLVWTHVAYPAAAEPSVTAIIPGCGQLRLHGVPATWEAAEGTR